MPTAVLLSGGARQRRARRRSAARPTRAARCSRSTSASGSRGKRPNARSCRGSSRAPPLGGRVRPLVSLSVDMRDVYAATHWAVAGAPPAYHTPDEDVYLPGRNVDPARQGGGLLRGGAASIASSSARSRTTRFPTRRRSSAAAHGARAVARPRARLRIDAPYADTARRTSSAAAPRSACRSS